MNKFLKIMVKIKIQMSQLWKQSKTKIRKMEMKIMKKKKIMKK